MLAVTAGAFLVITWIATKGLCFPSGVTHPLGARSTFSASAISSNPEQTNRPDLSQVIGNNVEVISTHSGSRHAMPPSALVILSNRGVSGGIEALVSGESNR